MASIIFIGMDGCGFSGISGMMDALNIASQVAAGRRCSHQTDPVENETGPLFSTRIASPDGRPFWASAGVSGRYQVTADLAWDQVSHADMVVIPSFLPNSDLISSLDRFTDRGFPTNLLVDRLCAWHGKGISLAALCTGAFVLAETGLLDGHLATTNWAYAGEFTRRYPRVRLRCDQVLTRDRGLICTGAVSAFYHLALHLIETFGGADLAHHCAKVFLVEYSRTSQASYAAFNMKKDHGDHAIFQAQEWMEAHLGQAISISVLALGAGISQRQFIRRFQAATGRSPLAYVQQLRVETAKHLLETCTDTVDDITRQVGYENTSTFCRLFKKITGLPPKSYRERFARMARNRQG